MTTEVCVDGATGRKYTLDSPDDPSGGGLTFILDLHGGGSVGAWQREYFPAYDHVERQRLVIATPSAATKEPFRMWVGEADDEHLQNVVNQVVDRFGADNIRAVWLVGHSQGGMTSNRLLRTDFFADRVDGWLSLSGGRLGPAEIPEDFGPPPTPGSERPTLDREARRRMLTSELPETDLSFIFAVGEHEIVALPETSPWAERYGASARVQQPDVVDDEPGKIHDGRWDGGSTKSWGMLPRPGTAKVFTYPGAAGGRVIADVVRLDKGHTEGLEPKVTELLVDMLVSAPGGKLHELDAT